MGGWGALWGVLRGRGGDKERWTDLYDTLKLKGGDEEVVFW